MDEFRLITLNPGHFHAALLQKEMHAGVSPVAHVYGPLSADLVEHVQRVARFNTRVEKPTRWELEVHAGPRYLERMIEERPGNVVVISGRNRRKIEPIRASVEAGLHVLADKPWIIASRDLPALETVLETAERKGLVAYDMMTERYEITSILQRLLVNDRETFGEIEAGSLEEPGVRMESVHHLLKLVAGAPNLRPAWFFDVEEQGEGLSDAGTHLADLAQWTLFPEQPVDFRREVEVVEAQRRPTRLTREEFRAVTGLADFPAELSGYVRDERLEYYCNTEVRYKLRGVWVKLEARWDYEAPAGGGDTHYAAYRGSKCRVEVRQGREENWRPELYVVAKGPSQEEGVAAALRRKVEELQTEFPGVGLMVGKGEMQVTIPDAHRVGHEAHFAQVARQFFEYARRPEELPAWEKANMLAKYFVTTKGVDLSRRGYRD